MKILGLDCGIASVGWALVEDGSRSEKQGIIAAGAWMFEAPEEKTQSKTRLKSELRRLYRGQRRITRRRRLRMNEIRRILHQFGLLDSCARDALKHPGLDPWKLRVEGLDRLLKPQEFAVALGHIARHRGFKSNAKRAPTTDAIDDTSKMKKAIEETRTKLARYETPARLIVAENSTDRRYRNREGDYSRSLLRDDLKSEMRKLFESQRRLQAAFATEDLKNRFEEIAFFQRPLQDSLALVGGCPFETDEKRTAKRGYSFELFRLLSRLRNLSLRIDKDERILTPQEIETVVTDFGATQKITFATLRKKLNLDDRTVFVGVARTEEAERDAVARSGEAAAGTARLRKIVTQTLDDNAWRALTRSPATLDLIAEIISFRNDPAAIRSELQKTRIDATLVDALAVAVADGKLDAFTGAAHISAKAARNIIPGLCEGLTYDKACARAGYDHTASREKQAFDAGVRGKEALAIILREGRISPELVGSPTTRKALIESIKQVKAIVEKYDIPDRINIEMARDVGKSIEERARIHYGIEKRNREKDRLRKSFETDIGRPPAEGEPGREEMLRYELWHEQNGRCLYTDTHIDPRAAVGNENLFQVDHILPWSRFGDDSFLNRTLCTTKANQDKKNRTPFEWFEAEKTEEEWRAFVARVESLRAMKGLKKRNYTLRDADRVVDKFRSRNLNDTRWTCRLLAEALRQLYAKDDPARRIFARPGALTDRLRRAWGLQWKKKDPRGVRIPDDRHHALDAIIVAATTESLLQRATHEVQKIESKGLPYDLTKNISPPWPDFREQARAAVENIFVARAERRRARGKAHDATMRHVALRDGEQKVYERKKVADLGIGDLARVKDSERNASLIESLRRWIEAGKPKDQPPLSPKGDIIFKVRLVTKTRVAIAFDTGNPERPASAERGEMARVDVFRKANRKGKFEYYLVPIYPHEIATLDAPPRRAAVQSKPEEEWTLIDDSFEFLWSITQMTWLQIVKKDGEVVEGYFRGMNRSTASIAFSDAANLTKTVDGYGVKTLVSFRKFAVDRFGNRCEVTRETRTWRGKPCI